MKKIIFVFLVGILTGLYLSSINKKEEIGNLNHGQAEVPPAIKSPEQAKEKVVAPTAPKRLVVVPGTSQVKEGTENKKLVALIITEDRVEAMEQNFPELHRDISLFKDERGWTVRFHRNLNLLSSIGIRDNDFIRFELFQELKKDPSKENLVSRLETIFANLER